MTLIPSPELEKMLDELQATGYSNRSQIMVAALINFHRKIFPVYAKAPPPPVTPEEAAAHDKQVREAKLKAKHDAQLSICSQLDGKVKGNICVYFKYADSERFEQEVPLSRMSQSLVETQYSPSKEKVLALLAKVKNKSGTV